MKKPSKKKSTTKNPPKSAVRKPKSAAKATGKRTPVNKQPQVKEQAAIEHGMFLYTDDAWSLRYFNQDDLHFLEREVFG